MTQGTYLNKISFESQGFYSTKRISKCRLQNGGHLFLGLNPFTFLYSIYLYSYNPMFRKRNVIQYSALTYCHHMASGSVYISKENHPPLFCQRRSYRHVAIVWWALNSMVSGKCSSNIKIFIPLHMLRIMFMSTSCEIAPMWIRGGAFEEKSTLFQAMAWCRPETNYQRNQFWPSSMTLYGVSRPKRVNLVTVYHWWENGWAVPWALQQLRYNYN